jgi:hypothetical protein
VEGSQQILRGRKRVGYFFSDLIELNRRARELLTGALVRSGEGGVIRVELLLPDRDPRTSAIEVSCVVVGRRF